MPANRISNPWFSWVLNACLFAGFSVAFTALAQPPPGRPNDNRPKPWDNDVLVYRVATNGRSEKLATFERAGVAALARLPDGRLISAFQHFPKDDQHNFDRVAVRFSSDEGVTWTDAKPIVVDGLESGLMRPFDPTLVPLPDGRVRLYFTRIAVPISGAAHRRFIRRFPPTASITHSSRESVLTWNKGW